MAKSKQKSMKTGMKVSGGSGKMFGKSGSSTQTPGVSSQEGRTAGGKPKGGTTKMFGKSGAGKVKPA